MEKSLKTIQELITCFGIINIFLIGFGLIFQNMSIKEKISDSQWEMRSKLRELEFEIKKLKNK